MLNIDTPVLLSLSGKGGVGKTLFSVGIAASLAKHARVGVLDLDIRSPNLTYIMGSDNTVDIDNEGMPLPRVVSIDGTSLPVFSSGMMFGDRTGIIMAGEEMQGLIRGMVFQVKWPDLDYLVVDMDPSPGDSLQAITDTMRHVSAFVVTTSDISSIQDCRRMLDACRHLDVSINGIVGNMIGVECPSCGCGLHCMECGAAVGFGDAQPVIDMALEYGVPYLGALPWNPNYKTDPVSSVQGMGKKLFDTLVKALPREVSA